jgi:hypothetical protein
VESITDKPFRTPFDCVVNVVFSCVLHALPRRKVTVTLEVDSREVGNQRVLDTTLRECGESHVILIFTSY